MADTSILSNLMSVVVKEHAADPAEYLLASSASVNQDLLFVHEGEGSATCRLCCPKHYPWSYHMHAGKSSSGPELAEYKRNLKCPMFPCKPCCYQTLYVVDGQTKDEIGWVREEFWVTVPTFSVRDNTGHVLLYLHHETCCTGLFFDCCLGGCCLLQPFQMYHVNPSNGRSAEEGDGQVSHKLASPSSLLGGPHSFEVTFPVQAANTHRDKVLLLGASWLINELYYKPFCGGCECSERCACCYEQAFRCRKCLPGRR